MINNQQHKKNKRNKCNNLYKCRMQMRFINQNLLKIIHRFTKDELVFRNSKKSLNKNKID